MKKTPLGKSTFSLVPNGQRRSRVFRDALSGRRVGSIEGKPGKPSAALAKSILQPRPGAKSPISIRLFPEQIEAAKKIAAAKSVGYQTQLRMWIAEGIRREAKQHGPGIRG